MFKKIYGIKTEVDENDTTPMLGEDAPLLEADIPGDTGRKALPAGQVCKQCGAPNSSDSGYCSKCNHLIVDCSNCGHVPEEGMSFCTKCGNPLN